MEAKFHRVNGLVHLVSDDARGSYRRSYAGEDEVPRRRNAAR